MKGAASVAKDAFAAFRRDNMTSVAAALAYYAFLSVPAALLVAVGTFGLLAGPGAVTTVSQPRCTRPLHVRPFSIVTEFEPAFVT